ncbi:hypothetical protein V2G26_010987 [Clonostachys chloroleuca]
MPDAITIELSYAGGLLINIHASALSVEARPPRFWIRGTKRSFHKQGLDPQEGQLLAGAQVADAEFGHESLDRYKLTGLAKDGSVLEGEMPELKPETYLAFYEAWGKAVASGQPDLVPVKASESRDVLRVIEAVVESSKTGMDVVS